MEDKFEIALPDDNKRLKNIMDMFGRKFRKKPVVIRAFRNETRHMLIHTLEGDLLANMDDWIIEGINGEYYPCKADIFEKTYEELNKNGNSYDKK